MRDKSFAIAILGLVVLISLTAISCGNLQNIKASVTGTVYMDGRPISGTVILEDMNGNAIGQERTTLSGHYQIKNVPAGTYKVRFLNMNGVPFGNAVTVEVRLGRPEVVDLKLSATDRVAF